MELGIKMLSKVINLLYLERKYLWDWINDLRYNWVKWVSYPLLSSWFWLQTWDIWQGVATGPVGPVSTGPLLCGVLFKPKQTLLCCCDSVSTWPLFFDLCPTGPLQIWWLRPCMVMVCPVTEKGQASPEVYFPEQDNFWFDKKTFDRYPGKETR